MGKALPSPVRLRQDVPCSALKENKTQLHELFLAPARTPSISVYKMASYSGKTQLERTGLQTELPPLLSHVWTVLALPVHFAPSFSGVLYPPGQA